MINDSIELFLPVSASSLNVDAIRDILQCNYVKNVSLWVPSGFDNSVDMPFNVNIIYAESLSRSGLYRDMAQRATADYVVCVIKEDIELPSCEQLMKMRDSMNRDSSMLYCDYSKMVSGECCEAPTIDYQCGSLRNDFDFGPAVMLRTSMLKQYLGMSLEEYEFAGFYQLRLAMSRLGQLQHLPLTVCCEREPDVRKSGEKQFDYVNPAQRDVQIEMEAVCTHHLCEINAWLPPYKYSEIDLSAGAFPVEASVIIPVLNRVTTIADAIRSVLTQKTDFKFNILVVDNHSTDGTGEIIESFDDDRVCHLIPERDDLGIGGCWNYAIESELCGRFAVQLDSDDLYSDSDTLQRIVDEFYKQQCAMLVGSYRICNFDLETLPPGVIDHREWSEENGRNNALRINGLGAPRAFYTPVVRNIGFPNVSYGEDYAVGLRISRDYRIGRIYDVLYLCRRWGGNSDAALSHEKVNRHNSYKDSLRSAELEARVKKMNSANVMELGKLHGFVEHQLGVWPQAYMNIKALELIRTRALECGVTLQYNPARVVSTAAKVDDVSIETRPCFLCDSNRPKEQLSAKALFDIEVLVNPYPILYPHLTLPIDRHTPQLIKQLYWDMLILAKKWKGMAIFYNGAKCGASAPDHAHLQAVNAEDVPMLQSVNRYFADMQPLLSRNGSMLYKVESYLVPLFAIESSNISDAESLFATLTSAMTTVEDEPEPRMNVMSFYSDVRGWVTVVVPRSKHRPDCYYSKENRRMISPGMLDMASLVVTPLEEDFETLSSEEVLAILQEVAIDAEGAEKIVSILRK
ncbi:MAG: DUF4922 domain-containing protein [Bacteroidaceae bacterium]|nr:DUF4922 domain-containing protein [Bacteroidaceae bacterium]